jgi:hypothetical protein
VQDDGTELVLGTIRAYRWWTLYAPDLNAPDIPAAAERWQPGWLRGAKDEWHSGVNTAACKFPGSWHRPADVPADGCGCGFWAYWRPHPCPLNTTGALPVFGVIETAGPEADVIIGEDGCRMSRARIVALHLSLTLQLYRTPADGSYRRLARARLVVEKERFPVPRRHFPGRVISIGTDHVPAPLRNAPIPDPEPDPSEQEIAEAKVRAEAWTAIMGDRLDQMYPGARVFEDGNALLKLFPPDPAYA